MNEGDVVLTPLPQADGTIKNRPALILRKMPPYRDFLVCGVSTQLHKEVRGFDEIIRKADPDSSTSGLRAVSLIRLGFLAALPYTKFIGSIGAIAPERHLKVAAKVE